MAEVPVLRAFPRRALAYRRTPFKVIILNAHAVNHSDSSQCAWLGFGVQLFGEDHRSRVRRTLVLYVVLCVPSERCPMTAMIAMIASIASIASIRIAGREQRALLSR